MESAENEERDQCERGMLVIERLFVQFREAEGFLAEVMHNDK